MSLQGAHCLPPMDIPGSDQSEVLFVHVRADWECDIFKVSNCNALTVASSLEVLTC